MKVPPRRLWFPWALLLVLLAVLVAQPIANRLTHLGELAMCTVVWIGLLALLRQRRPLRFVLLTLTALAVVFLMLPARGNPDLAALRRDYTDALRRYEGVRYVWGGENSLGIDCSGFVRAALALWWRDCSARDLGALSEGRTVAVLETPAINVLDTAPLQPGDLAVTRDGVHDLSYLGDLQWIEADPGSRRRYHLHGADRQRVVSRPDENRALANPSVSGSPRPLRPWS